MGIPIYAEYWSEVIEIAIFFNVAVILGSLSIIAYIRRISNHSVEQKDMIALRKRDYGSFIALRKHFLSFFLMFTVIMNAAYFVTCAVYTYVYRDLFDFVSSASSSSTLTPTVANAVIHADLQIRGFIGYFGSLFLFLGGAVYFLVLLLLFAKVITPLSRKESRLS